MASIPCTLQLPFSSSKPNLSSSCTVKLNSCFVGVSKLTSIGWCKRPSCCGSRTTCFVKMLKLLVFMVVNLVMILIETMLSSTSTTWACLQLKEHMTRCRLF
ncbi:hypothetical protein K7X08_022751 [Anisodus acutangulus]|uniref:Uncharacterized protein n=1 Tax=Anisodus acutangulus TaxID=402998 RepID=A0A9Q1RGP9_9SOLA|nr:hypothetical protein K7X08_022751 [Anisodus acutangulus]